MADAALAQTYARAVFEKAVEKYTHDLHALANAVANSNLLTRLDNAAESFESKKALINGLVPAQADPEVRNLALLLASKNQMHLLSDVVNAFDHLVAQGTPGALGIVTSAIALTATDKEKLEAKLRAQYGEQLNFEYRLDPAILGGLIVRIGDVVIDGSVSGKLAVMKQKLETAR
ncbi:MAG: ATP synthase subunit delta [Anaerolineae bacterium]|nr:ATP synthase subunit delta [Anaerolineae bacterium]RIK34620.1 MAG: ATP synthase F1 subunit delta [Chloroflexota bacterium]